VWLFPETEVDFAAALRPH